MCGLCCGWCVVSYSQIGVVSLSLLDLQVLVWLLGSGCWVLVYKCFSRVLVFSVGLCRAAVGLGVLCRFWVSWVCVFVFIGLTSVCGVCFYESCVLVCGSWTYKCGFWLMLAHNVCLCVLWFPFL